MKTEVSILIPTFNDECYDVVVELTRQIAKITPLKFEILVGDDGSTNETIVNQNQQINEIDGCRYIRREKNSGRAFIRNFLAQQARFEWLLFIDSGMGIVRNNFIKTYLETELSPVYGGYIVESDESAHIQTNLRYLYETASAPKHRLSKRLKNPNHDFHTSNFFVNRQLFLQHPLDERFRHYGYEDIFWGKQLLSSGITIHHIDNPIAFNRFETNEQFMAKTEEGLRTLNLFRNELSGFSRLLKTCNIIHHLHIEKACAKLFKMKQEKWRKNLCSQSPSLRLFRFYKLFYLLSTK